MMTDVIGRWLAAGLVAVVAFGPTTARAQSIQAGTLEWTLAVGGGASLPDEDRRLETVTSVHLLPHVGYFVTGEIGEGALRGNFELLVEPTLIYLDASNSATVSRRGRAAALAVRGVSPRAPLPGVSVRPSSVRTHRCSRVWARCLRPPPKSDSALPCSASASGFPKSPSPVRRHLAKRAGRVRTRESSAEEREPRADCAGRRELRGLAPERAGPPGAASEGSRVGGGPAKAPRHLARSDPASACYRDARRAWSEMERDTGLRRIDRWIGYANSIVEE
jgi:hypothetical protein